MEQTLFRVHVRVVHAICGVFNRPARVLIEKVLLFVALASLVCLYLLHTTYVSTQNTHTQNCLSQALRRSNLHAYPPVSADVQEGMPDILKFSIENEWDVGTPFAFVKKSLEAHIQSGNSIREFARDMSSSLEWALDNRYRRGAPEESVCTKKDDNDECVTMDKIHPHNGNKHTSASYIIAKEKGMLHLSPETMQAHNFSVHTVTISAQDDCFGPPAFVWLLEVWMSFYSIFISEG
jgi:hypothetical protein